MSRAGRRAALVALALVVLIVGTVWWLAGDRGGAGTAPGLERSRGDDVVDVLPEPSAAIAAHASFLADPQALELPAGASVTPPTGPLAIRVEHAHGVPATGARVGLYTPEPLRYVAEGVLDERGAWSHPGLDAPAAFFVVGVTPRAERFDLDVARGEHTLTLPEGAVISGRVLVDGAVPRLLQPLALGFKGYEYWDEPPAGMPLAGADRLLELAWLEGHVYSEVGDAYVRGCYADAAGRFTFSGLEAGATYRIGTAWGAFRHSPRSTPQPITAPAADVLLEWESPPFLVGRVVDAAGVPVPGADIELQTVERQLRWWSRINESNELEPVPKRVSSVWELYAATCDEQGRFRIPFHASSYSREPPEPHLEVLDPDPRIDVDLIASAGDERRAVLRVRELAADMSHDVGDLVLKLQPRFIVRVVDELGAPLEDARLRTDHSESGLARTYRTDERGFVAFDFFDTDVALLTVVARGYETARIALPEQAPSAPIVVELSPAVVLEVIVTWPAGFEDTPGWYWRLDLWGPPPLFTDASLPPARSGYAGENLGALNSLRLDWAGDDSISTNTTNPDYQMLGYESETNSMLLEGLRANHPITLELTLFEAPETFGPIETGVRWRGGRFWFEPGEHRTVHVDMSGLEPKQ
ncbi:MAG: hypothetical protein DHS20C15_28520 [Planctomycetota bacterium]|nr:MAG: hypothetical protein DHS20C15_28520 [Planctomycetota bacterium]